jgi:hypothetical protein
MFISGSAFSKGNTVRFDVGSSLSTLSVKTQTSADDLGVLVRRLAQAAVPLEGKFSGPAKATFDRFKSDVDEVAMELTKSLAVLLEGIHGQATAFHQGSSEMNQVMSTAVGHSDFDAARFAGR